MTDIDELLTALAPYVERAVADAVAEAVRRAAMATPIDGVIEEVSGATGVVAVAGQSEGVPCTIAADLSIGDHVVVVFYSGGIAYAHGPIPGPPPVV